MNQNIENNNNINNNINNNNNNNKVVEMVYSLLEMLRLSSAEEMSTKLLLMSQSPQICREMRQYGCLPLLIQLLHQQNEDMAKESLNSGFDLRQRASKTLRNIINNSSKSRRELRVLRLIEDLRAFVDVLRLRGHELTDEFVDHPNSSAAHLLKVSFDEEHRHVIGLLGGVYAIAEVIQYDYDYHRNTQHNSCINLRRYSLMTLTNLTFGDSQTKSLLGTMKPFMKALVHNLQSPAEELRQVVASVLRNLSWKADYISKQILRDVGAVTLLTQAALEATKESTLKSILSALWNLTAHCAPNKADFCKVEGALPFLISTLTYTSSNNTVTIIENGGGILRNISSHIVINDDYREILRKHNTIGILLEQLKSPSLTVVSNSCVTLWNLSARCPKDQRTLWESGAVPMLRNLVNSRHKMIAMGASATLKNLFSSQIAGYYMSMNGNSALSPSSSCSIPSLQARKLKALKDELNSNLSETCDNIESPKVSPTHQSCLRHSASITSNVYLPGRMYNSYSGYINPHQVSRSNSHDSIGSTHSEPVPKFGTIDHNFRSVAQDSCVYPFTTQVMPHVFATLPSNSSRVRDKDLDSTSDFDVYCGESTSQLNVSNSSAKSSSFTDTELDEDPEPTDYSQRYKEQPVDEFTAPRSVNKTEVVGSEDSVKVYRTEGTPLNFSLASSLSDLREAGLRSINEVKETKSDENNTKSNNNPENNVKTAFKKPIPPPKPKFSIPLRNPITGENIVVNKSPINESKPIFNDINTTSTNSIVSIGVSNENVCEETPLMYSRSSSLGSLSSCDVKSDICQSSVVSEFSVRASEVVSPSDLPDSPCQSLAVSPKQISYLPPKEPQNSDQQNVTEKLNNNNNSNNNLKEENNVFEDRAINYATEGTPAMFSLSTSLSSLHEDLNSSFSINDIEVNNNNNMNNNNSVSNEEISNDIIEVDDIKPEINSSSSEDEDDVELLAACISSGIKKVTTNETISRNSRPKIDSKKVVLTVTPPKAIPLPINTTKPVSQMSRSAPDGRSSYLESDSLRVFQSEGTPIQLSHSNSISELSISTNNSKHEISVNQSHNHSDESEDEDIILRKCIESGMPANNRNKSLTSSRSPKTPKTTPNISPNSCKVEENQSKCGTNVQNNRFFVEDTPIELSQCHSSLSSLSIDDSDDGFDDQKLLEAAISKGMKTISSKIKTTVPVVENNDILKPNKFDTEEDDKTYTICHQSERKNHMKFEANKMMDSLMMSSVMTDSSCLSDIENTKPLSLMDNIMSSSTESFSYKQIQPKPRERSQQQKKSDELLLDNVKPPSLMDEISLTQSCASISSDISDISLDLVNNTNGKNEIIANAAIDCARDLQSLTISCNNSDKERIDRMCPPSVINRVNLSSINTSKNNEYDFELSDTEISEDLPIDSEEVKTITENDVMLDMNSITSSSATLLPMESPTICADIIAEFDIENQKLEKRQLEIAIARENARLSAHSLDDSENSLVFDQKRMSPIGSEDLLMTEHLSYISGDESEPDSHATYNVNSPRRAKIVKPVIRKIKNNKEDIQYPTPQSSHSPTSRPMSGSVKHRCLVKATRTSALRASRSRSAETHFDEELSDGHQEKAPDRHSYSSRRIRSSDQTPDNSFNQNSNNSNNNGVKSRSLKNTITAKEINSKLKEKSLLSNVKSKLSTSLSSHNLGSSNVSLSSSSSNGMSPSCSSFSRRLEVQSRIASLWKRSKSSPNEKTDNSLSIKNAKNADLNRSVTARRSFGKSNKNNSKLTRSSTYEKLPQSAEEAQHIQHIDVKHDNHCKRLNNNNNKQDSSSKRHQIDKTNGNLITNSSLKYTKTNTNSLNNNVINNKLNANQLTANDVIYRTTPSKSSSKSHQNDKSSRRTCLVTAV